MKNFEISKSSWHYKFVNKMLSANAMYLFENVSDKQNTCEYMKLFVGALITALTVLAAFMVLLVYPLASVGQELGFWALFGKGGQELGIGIAAFLVLCPAVIMIATYIVELITELVTKRTPKPKTEGSFSALLALKRSKICAPIILKD